MIRINKKMASSTQTIFDPLVIGKKLEELFKYNQNQMYSSPLDSQLLELARVSWDGASQKHRDEECGVYNVDQNGARIQTDVTVPRALWKVVDALKSDDGYGPTLGAARVLMRNQGDGTFLITTLSAARQAKESGLKYDIGPGGMVQSNSTFKQTAEEEIFEELGIEDVAIKFFGTIDPRDGAFGFVHVYICDVDIPDLTVLLRDTDGTFENIEWMTVEQIKADKHQFRHDAQIVIDKLL